MKKNIYRFQRDFLGEGSVRVEKKSGDTSFSAHHHEYFEIILYRKCDGKCIVNGNVYPIFGDCMFFLTPKDYHKIETSNPDGASSVILSFSENLIDADLFSHLAFYPRVWYAPTAEAIAVIEMLYENYIGRSQLRTKKIFHTLNLLLSEVAECGQVLGDGVSCISPAIARTITVVLSDISKGYTLKGLARECGLSAAYFSNLFHREMGKCFKEWLNEARIEHAKGLLLESDLSILEICYECGYNTPSQFIRMFKRATEMPPSEYRRASEGNGRACVCHRAK